MCIVLQAAMCDFDLGTRRKFGNADMIVGCGREVVWVRPIPSKPRLLTCLKKLRNSIKTVSSVLVCLPRLNHGAQSKDNRATVVARPPPLCHVRSSEEKSSSGGCLSARRLGCCAGVCATWRELSCGQLCQ